MTVTTEPEETDATVDDTSGKSPDDEVNRNWIQKFYDNPWILLALGLLIPLLSYTVWGWIDLLSVPPAQLP